MHFIIFLIILFLIWLIFGERIKRWIAGFMARRMEDYLRKATGMPPRPGSKEGRRQERARQNAQADTASGRTSSRSDSAYGNTRRTAGASRRRRRAAYTDAGPLIPKEYAIDVEFVETKSYSEATIAADDGRRKETIYHESQVSDVEWEEIKIRK